MRRLVLWLLSLAVVMRMLTGIALPLRPGEQDPVVTAFAVVRLVALGIAWYLVGIVLLAALARATRVPALIRGTQVFAFGPVRRLVHLSVTASVGLGALSTPASASGSPASHDPPVIRSLQEEQPVAPLPNQPPASASEPSAGPPASHNPPVIRALPEHEPMAPLTERPPAEAPDSPQPPPIPPPTPTIAPDPDPPQPSASTGVAAAPDPAPSQHPSPGTAEMPETAPPSNQPGPAAIADARPRPVTPEAPAPHPAQTNDAPPLMRSVADSGRTRPSPEARPALAPDPAPLPPQQAGTWVVSRGDSFWAIAETLVPTPEVPRYWRELIEANRGRLADPDNPDLLFVGQELALPTRAPP